VAKAYRLLKAILNTATDDGVIKRNPCRIKGAGQEDSPERPTLTIAQVYALADAVGQRYRALVLMGTFTSLRWGELAALRRCDIDLEARTVRVVRQLAEVPGGFAFGPPKSRAGKRVVPIPDVIIPVIQWHLSCFAEPGDDGLLFTSPGGNLLHHSNFRLRVWIDARAAAGLGEEVHFHDLRHTGNTLAATAGATLRELMDRMGHDSERAAMIYLHGSDTRQQQIADTLSKLTRDELRRSGKGKNQPGGQRSGTQRARGRKRAS
jgi:integrase